MRTMPVLQTKRLLLRPFVMADAPEVQRLADSYEIASTTVNIPHPYRDGVAEAWIDTHGPAFDRGESLHLAITLAAPGRLIGAIGLMGMDGEEAPELGYWVGVPWWNEGYCTEAGRALLTYAFNDLGIYRVFARHFRRNPASGRVMQKLGMQYEGCLRQHVLKWGVYEDVNLYGILRAEWQALNS